MPNEDLVKKAERSLWSLIDLSTAAGRLEQQDTARGLCETDFITLNAFRFSITLHRKIIMNIVKHLADKGVENESKKETGND